jgi:predicted short-subunit dehydrogenase-like oxidoreductase (DUF2520 family)
MRELEPSHAANTTHDAPATPGPVAVAEPEVATIVVVGRGRVGNALSAALSAAGARVSGPHGREPVPEADAILLCVPDTSIREAAAAVAGAAPFVGHTSGATPLAALDPAVEAGADAFGLHPLQTFPGAEEDAERLAESRCAVAGSTPAALALAASLASMLGMTPFPIDDDSRSAYHAAASIASNFLVTLEAAAERVASGAGIEPATVRAALAPLVRATVENWAELGPEAALTGPVSRGDELTVAAQRAAVERVAPEVLELFDILVRETQALAGRGDVK